MKKLLLTFVFTVFSLLFMSLKSVEAATIYTKWKVAVADESSKLSAGVLYFEMKQQGEQLTGIDPQHKIAIQKGTVKQISSTKWQFSFRFGESNWKGFIVKEDNTYHIVGDVLADNGVKAKAYGQILTLKVMP